MRLRKSGQLSETASKEEIDAMVSNTSYSSIIFQNWVARSCQVALIPLLVTAVGGALAGIIKSAAAVETLGNAIADTGLPPILIPFLISSVIYTACGSTDYGWHYISGYYDSNDTGSGYFTVGLCAGDWMRDNGILPCKRQRFLVAQCSILWIGYKTDVQVRHLAVGCCRRSCICFDSFAFDHRDYLIAA